jgi:hypothetical protein|tara:strand:+ start:1271 stop:1780 length:510 start_codon:yes stop_codon:yes gene_type:complete
MELSNIDYRYKIKTKKFDYINYNFKLPSNVNNGHEATKLAKEAMVDLEKILDNYYSGRNFKKEQDGIVTSRRVTFGHRYSSVNNVLTTFQKYTSSNLDLDVAIDESGESKDISLHLMNHDGTNERLIKIYDSITDLPELTISDTAKKEIEKINSLIFDNFQINKYFNSD